MSWDAFGISLQGSRHANQDCYLIDPLSRLVAVADGVGGAERGEVASEMAIWSLKQAGLSGPLELKAAFEKAQRAIHEYALRELGSLNMGTTLTAALEVGEEIHFCHVGDSRAYELKNNMLVQLTQDHEHWEDRVGGPVLASYLGIDEDYYPLTISSYKISKPDSQGILLCSDGLYRQMTDSQMAQAVFAPGPLKEAVTELAHEAASHPQSDNVTALVWKF